MCGTGGNVVMADLYTLEVVHVWHLVVSSFMREGNVRSVIIPFVTMREVCCCSFITKVMNEGEVVGRFQFISMLPKLSRWSFWSLDVEVGLLHLRLLLG